MGLACPPYPPSPAKRLSLCCHISRKVSARLETRGSIFDSASTCFESELKWEGASHCVAATKQRWRPQRTSSLCSWLAYLTLRFFARPKVSCHRSDRT